MIKTTCTTARTLLAAIGLSLASVASAFDVAGLRIGDTVEQFQALESPAKEYLTITHDPDGKIVRLFYRQEGLPNDEKTQAKLVNRICTSTAASRPVTARCLRLNQTTSSFCDSFICTVMTTRLKSYAHGFVAPKHSV